MVKYALIFSSLFSATISLAQILDYTDVEKLQSTVNTDAEESMPLLTPDGKKLFFTRALSLDNNGGKYSGHDVWVSDRNDIGWTKANNKLSFNNTNNNAVIGMSTDGNVLYLMDASPNKKISGIYFSKKAGASWMDPEFIPIPHLDGIGFAGFYVSPDFDVIFISMKGLDTKGEEDLYFSQKNTNGSWNAPKNLGPVVNTGGFEISPFLSANKKRLYFASSGHEGLGNADIYYCDKLYDSWETWSAPRNLGPKVNSDKFDAFFSIYGDTVAYLSSNRGGKMADLYKVKVIPGDEVYAITQRYLPEKDMNELLGGKVSRKFTFNKSEIELNAAQKELLYFIANKLLRKTDINFHIVVVEENEPEISDKRQSAIYDFLRQSGIENYRIQMGGKPKNNTKTTNGVLELILFK
jgi:hypothetical protein